MTEASAISHQCLYRRTEMVLPGLLVLVALLILGIYLLIQYVVDGNTLLTAILSLLGGFVLVVVVIAIAAFRVNTWTIEPGGLRISERPKVPLFGLHQRFVVPFAQVRALRWLESGFDHILEIVTAQGRCHRMMKDPIAKPDPGASLENFAEAIRAAARQAGHELPATSEGLSWWNSAIGIGFLAILFAVTCVIAGAVGWALLDGMTLSGGARGGQAAAIALVLPFGCGYLLLKTIRRRRRVLAALAR